MIAESAVTAESALSADCRRKLTWSADHIIGVCQIDNDDLVGIVDALTTVRSQPRNLTRGIHSHANEVIRLKREVLEGYRGGLNAESGELKVRQSYTQLFEAVDIPVGAL